MWIFSIPRLGKIFESFSGADSLRDRPFRKELLNSLNPELKSNLMHAFDKSEDDDYQELVKLVINKPLVTGIPQEFNDEVCI